MVYRLPRLLPEEGRAMNMNSDVFAGKLKQARGSLRRSRGMLMRSRLDQVLGGLQHHAGVLQERRGVLRNRFERAVRKLRRIDSVRRASVTDAWPY